MAEKKPDSVDISVIIVTWNSANVITACVDSVINNSKELNIELIIIDNDSDDNTFSVINSIHYPNLKTYKNTSNTGFTKAVNQALAIAGGRNVFLLNPDTVLDEKCIFSLSSYIDENPEYGACAPIMLNEDGSLQYSVRNFPTYLSMYFEFTLLAYVFPHTKILGKWKMKYYNYDKDDDVNQPMAAAFMYRRELIDKMDERFEMFFSDVDICKRIIDNEKKIRLLTTAKVIHKQGESIHKVRSKMIRVWSRDCFEYFKKYHPNALMLLWLRISLKISEILRILYYNTIK